MNKIKILLAVMLLTLTSATAFADTDLNTLSEKERLSRLTQTDDLLSCAVLIRQSFPDNQVLKTKDSETGITVFDLYTDLYETAETHLLKYAPKITKEDIADMVAVKNTLFYKLSDEEKNIALMYCDKMLSGNG